MKTSRFSPLTRNDLWSLEEYAELRPTFRKQVMAHKKNRQVAIGPHLTLYFEDRLTLLYQIQEMLRIEKVFEAAGIAEELNVYNPLLPTGKQWKATLMIEYSDATERNRQLKRMLGIEHKIWIQVKHCEKVWGIADEDLERSNRSKTSAVHFLRFELSSDMIKELQRNNTVLMGVKHEAYTHEQLINEATRQSLLHDLKL